MSTISAVSNLHDQSSSFLNPAPAEIRTTGSKNLGVDDFLKLIPVQLSNQDPLKPMEDTQFISQMASFTSLEQMQKLAQDFSTFTAQQKQTSAQDYLGRTVTVTDGKTTATGAVTKVSFQDGAALLSINGQDYDVASVLSISTGAAAAAGSAPITSAGPTVPAQ